MKNRPFTKLEEDYIRRVAGRVPVQVMSELLECNTKKVRDFCTVRRIPTRVPTEIFKKHYPDLWRKYFRARPCLKRPTFMKVDVKASCEPEQIKKNGWVCSDFGVSRVLMEINQCLESVRCR